MSAPLVIGLPSKGRLQENAFAFLAAAGLSVHQAGGGRGYRGGVDGLDGVEVAFLSASEIAGNLEQGTIHFGITGEDLIRETIADPETAVELLLPLSFGHADVVVAVPKSWIDVRSMADLDDVALAFHAGRGRRLRVATKFLNLTRAFFSEHGVTDYRIVESLGATEGAPAAGAAEIIVDITSSGATLAANDLKVLDDGTILKSQAQLVASMAADWPPEVRAAAARVLDMIAARDAARGVTEVRFLHDLEDTTLLNELAERFGAAVPFPYDEDAARVALVVHVPTKNLQAFARFLHESGKTTVTATRPDYIFQAQNPLTARLNERLR